MPPKMYLDSIIQAIEKNPVLLAYDEKINAINAYAKGARSWEAPQMGTGFWMTPYNFTDNKNTGMYMISVQQMIPNPAKLRTKESYMKGMASTESFMQNTNRQDLIKETKSLYYKWLILKKKQKTLKESEELLNVLIKISEIEYTYNQQNLARVYKTKSELYQLSNMQINLANEIAQKNIDLNRLMNTDKDFAFDIDTNYVIKSYDSDPLDSASIVNSRSDIRTLNESIKVARLKQSIELGRKKPDFGFQYSHMNAFGNQPNQFTLMGMMTIPIAPWASKEYKANQAGLEYEMAMYKKQQEAIYNEVSGKLNSIKKELASKKSQLHNYEKSIVPALQNNYKATMVAYQHQEEDLFMVLDAWQALIMAKLEYIDRLNEILQLQVEYEREIER